MWLAGHTYAFRSLPLERALERLAALGFEDVEVWLGHATGDVSEAVRAVDDVGVRVRAVSAGGFYSPGDKTPARALELAGALEVDLVVMCTVPDLAVHLDRLAGSGVCVAVENHWDQRLARSSDVVSAIRALRLQACLDTGHALMAGERPDVFALALGDRLAHVHLKDGRFPTVRERAVGRRLRRRFLTRPSPVWPGEGDLDVVRLCASLEAVGFDGCVTIEHEGPDPDDALAELAARWRHVA